MYISTSHSIGETVYYYSAVDDTVTRAKVVQISYIKTEEVDEVRYWIRIRNSEELREVSDGTLYTRPESAFYSNPRPVPEPEAVSA